MRVIAGELRGRPLRAPTGDATRPTADRVRESLFNLIGPRPAGERVLDLFAGSGALGIEALSRGALFARFVERRAAARSVLLRNLGDLGLRSRAQVASGDAAARTAWAGGPWDLVLADPPYGAVDLASLLAGLAPALAADGVIALEHAGEEPPPEAPETLSLWKARRYGGTGVSLYVREEEPA